MLIDRYLDRWDVRARYETVVHASAPDTYEAVRELDMGDSIPVTALVLIRAVPHLLTGKARLTRSLTLDTFVEGGFMILAEKPGHELVLGAVGKFWRPASGIVRIKPSDFVSFDRPGVAKAVLNFTVTEQTATTSILATETRVLCTDAAARRSFGLYWRLIGPFSGVIRHLMLRKAKRAAEARRDPPIPPGLEPASPDGRGR